MKFTWTNEGGDNGPVTGLNRSATGGETEGNVSPQSLIYGMDNDFYEVISGSFAAKSQGEVDSIIAQRDAAAAAQAQTLADLEARVAEMEGAISGDGFEALTLTEIDTKLDNLFDFTDYDAAPDNAALKIEIKTLLENIKSVVRKMSIRVNKLSDMSNRN